MIENLEIINMTQIEIDEDKELFWSSRFSDENKGIFKIKNKFYEAKEKIYNCSTCYYNDKKECLENYIIEQAKKEIYYICDFEAKYIFVEITDKRRILIESLNENIFEIKLLVIKE